MFIKNNLKRVIKDLSEIKLVKESWMGATKKVGSPETVDAELRNEEGAKNCEITINTLIEVYFSDDAEVIERHYTGNTDRL